MSSSYVKGRLKASREAIQAKDWEAAIEAATQALEEEKDNYNGHVFTGLALLNQGKIDKAEESYRTAIRLQPTQPLAWQGLDKLFTDNEKWDALAGLIKEQMDACLAADDTTKLAELQQRLVALQREHGTQTQIAEALANYLVGSPYHDLLSTLPIPDQTSPAATSTFDAQMAIHVESLAILLEIIAIREQVEKTTLDKEVEKRKTRLDSAGKSREQLRNDIGIEIWERSSLPELYDQVLSHSSAADDVRRDAEHKLLLYRMQLLKALLNPRARLAAPSGNAATASKQEEDDARAQDRKDKALQSVQELANGIVTINVADELAWTHVLDTTDVFYLTDLDFARLRAYISHFPRSGLAASLRALLLVLHDAQYLKEQKELEERTDVEVAPSDPLVLALDGLEQAPTCILAHRIAAVLYLRDRDWLSCSEVATAGLTLAKRAENSLSVDLKETKAGFEAALAASLVYLHPPQHHTRALRLYDSVLSLHANDTDGLLGKALVHQSAGRWQQAQELLASVTEKSGTKDAGSSSASRSALAVFENPAREARLEMAWCDVHLNKLTEAESSLRAVLGELNHDIAIDATEHARTWWRLGYCLWQQGGEHRTDRSQAFTCFITALKKDAVFAPAFTSLGFYYQDAANPPDHQRASKCFQKAFELDAGQNAAARQLAEIYAKDDDWDLVDLVARRSVEAEGGGWILKSGSNANVRRHTTENAWAWSAVGSTELVRGNQEKAIVAFQVALRSHPSYAHLWMRLGEAYVASQRFSAAIKAFERAHSLQDSGDQWQASFCIASVQLQLGMYDEAIATFEHLVDVRPNNLEMLCVCATARWERARRDAREGYSDRASRAVVLAIAEAHAVLEQDERDHAAWKVASDGLLFLADHASALEETKFVEMCLQPLLSRVMATQVDEEMSAITAVTYQKVEQHLQNTPVDAKEVCLRSAAFLCKARVFLFAENGLLSGSVWMDLAVALDALKTQITTSSALSDASTDVAEQVQDCHRQAIACVKEALKAEPGNEVFWTSLGNLVFEQGVPLAQHCYIKAIDCNSKSAIPWTNLGFLYLANEDRELASEAFLRAQTIEPDYGPVWVGHALVARMRGERDAAQSMFHNAHLLSQGSVLEAAYGFAASTLESSRSRTSSAQLQSSAYALVAYLAKRPDDAAALHLSALLAESLGRADLAVERIDRASAIIEAQYEKEESSDSAQRFAICMVNVGRIHLSLQDYDRAQEVFEMSLGLLETAESGQEDGVDQKSTTENLKERIRLSAHCGIGLSHAARKDWTSARSSLQEALDETDDLKALSRDARQQALYEEARQTLIVLLAQTSFASGAVDATEDLLMGEVSENPHALRAMALLGALSASKGDTEQLGVIVSDLQDQTAVASQSKSSSNAALSFLCLCLEHEGRADEAVGILRQSGSSSTSRDVMLARLLLRQALRCDDATQRAILAQQAQEVAATLASSLKKDQAQIHADGKLSEALQMQALANLLLRGDTNLLVENAQSQSSENSQSSTNDGTLVAQSLMIAPQAKSNWTTLAQSL